MSAYESIQAINWSSLKHLATSPLLYRWRVDHPEPPKPAYILGSAIHCLLLEPADFPSRFAEFAGTRRGRDWDEWQRDHPGRQSLKPDEFQQVERTVAAVRAHRGAMAILDGCRHEEPLTWVEPQTGLACKGRLDALNANYVVDLKSARDVEPELFTRASARYLYHGQLAWYHDGAVAAGRLAADAQPPYLIAVQSDGPHDVVVWRIPPAVLDRGRALYRRLLSRWRSCTEADWWPGCAPDVQTLTLPLWSSGATTTNEEEF